MFLRCFLTLAKVQPHEHNFKVNLSYFQFLLILLGAISISKFPVLSQLRQRYCPTGPIY